MGLDTVEFVMSLESEFELEIPDVDAEGLRTPREAVTYVRRFRPDLPATEIERVIQALVVELGVPEFGWDRTWHDMGLN